MVINFHPINWAISIRVYQNTFSTTKNKYNPRRISLGVRRACRIFFGFTWDFVPTGQFLALAHHFIAHPQLRFVLQAHSKICIMKFGVLESSEICLVAARGFYQFPWGGMGQGLLFAGRDRPEHP